MFQSVLWHLFDPFTHSLSLSLSLLKSHSLTICEKSVTDAQINWPLTAIKVHIHSIPMFSHSLHETLYGWIRTVNNNGERMHQVPSISCKLQLTALRFNSQVTTSYTSYLLTCIRPLPQWMKIVPQNLPVHPFIQPLLDSATHETPVSQSVSHFARPTERANQLSTAATTAAARENEI